MKKPIIPIALASGVVLSGTLNVQVAFAEDSVVLAKKELNTPYQWGQNDCSGFTKKVFGKLGINLPHSSVQQARLGTPVSKSNLKPGDLVFFNTSGKGISHVGIYVGGGWMISSENEKTGVHETQIFGAGSARYWEPRFVIGRRLQQKAFDSVKTYVHPKSAPLSIYPAAKQSKRTLGDPTERSLSSRYEKPKKYTNYTVKIGDTLSEISQRAAVSVSELKRMNGLSTDLIKPGQVLRLESQHTAPRKRTVIPLVKRALLRSAIDKQVQVNQSKEQVTRGTVIHTHSDKTNAWWSILAQQGISATKFQKMNHQNTIRLFPGQKLYLQ